MAITDTIAAKPSYLEWGPILAGAIAAAALSFLLLTFGSAVGLSLTSPWPGAGAKLWVVALALAWWMVLVQIASFAAGGYLAGRMRSRWMDSRSAEGAFRDSTHGFMVWAVGVLMGAAVLAIVGLGAAKTGAEAASTVAAGAASGNLSKSGLAMGPADYAVDLLLRPQPGQTTGAAGDVKAANASNDDALRAETGRIFAGAIKNQALTARDRTYLTQIVASRTGLPQPEAQARVDSAVTEARDLEIKAREQADKARKTTLITAFIAAMSLLISLVVATAAAAAGGRHRDEDRIPMFAGHRFW